MSQKHPPIAVFPDLNCVIRLPSGPEYRGKLRQHPSSDVDGEHWYEGYLKAEHKDHVTADTVLKDRFNRDGLRPSYFHPQSNAEPLRIKLNRLPVDKRSEKNADTLIGEVWNHEGLWTVVCSPSESPSLHLAGSVVPSKIELAFAGSEIRQFHPQQPEEETAPPAPPRGKPARPASRP